jgi:hypothetical protein
VGMYVVKSGRAGGCKGWRGGELDATDNSLDNAKGATRCHMTMTNLIGRKLISAVHCIRMPTQNTAPHHVL